MNRASSPFLCGLAALGLFATGCGSVETHAAMLRAPTTGPQSGNVEIYLDSQTIGRPVEEMGFVQAFGSGSMANPEDVVRGLADRAGEMGCDAVVKVSIDIGYTRAHAAGVCVKWVGPLPVGTRYVSPDLRPSRPPENRTKVPAKPGPQPRIEPLPSNPKS
jgi:hypothetical protein